MRPKLRGDVRYVPSGAGVQVFSAAGSFGLAGASVGPLLDQLAGLLDGTHTLSSIVDGLPPRHRQVVTKLIDVLVQRRVVFDAEAERPHQLREWELARYRQEVTFAELASGSGAYWFERFRLSKVLLVGAGDTLDSLVGTVLQLGARLASVLSVSDQFADAGRYRSLLAGYQGDDPLLELTEVSGPGRWDSVTQVRSWLAGYDAVLHCDDVPRLARTVTLNRAARLVGIPALHAVTVPGSVWVGPAAGDDLGCWECAWRYLAGSGRGPGPGWAADRLDDRAPPGPPLAPTPTRSMAGAMLAMAYFRLVTEGGTGTVTTNRLIRIDPETATAREHRFVRHPGCRACPTDPPTRPAIVDRMAAVRAGPRRSDAGMSRGAAAIHDPALGILLSVDEGDHQQLPLVVTVATVNELTGPRTAPRRVAAVGPDHLRARRRVVVRALETAAWLATSAAPGAGWAWDVAAEAVVRTPAVADPARRSVAAGYQWAEAVGRGLLRHGARLATDAAGAAGGQAVGQLPDHARQLLEAVQVLGVRLRLEDWTQPLGVPVVAVHRPGRAPVVVAALDLAGALVAALEETVGQIQREYVAGRPVSAEPAADRADPEPPDPTSPEPPDVASGHVPPDLGDERWPGALGWLTRCLGDRGWRVLARPLTLAPALADQLPLLAEVTLVPVRSVIAE